MSTAVASKFLAVDPYLKNAYSSSAKFDIDHRSLALPKARPTEGKKANDVMEAVEVAVKANQPKEWELDVRSLTSSRKWLQQYGLNKYRLKLHQIMPSIGFKLSDGFDETLKKPVSSRYGGGLFRHLMRADGKTFNVACSKDKLMQLEKRLLQAIYLFRRRLEWLTTESRRVFGVIEERSVTIVLDIRNMSPQQFDQYRTALERVLREQVSQLAKFNMIRASEELQMYSPTCVAVSHDTLETAVQWIWKLDRLATVSNTSAAEGIVQALRDAHNEAIYLFTEGTSVDSGKEVLKEKVVAGKFKTPVSVVSFNCDSSETVKFLKEFTQVCHGKFHAYAVVMELDAYEVQPSEGVAKANILLRRKTFGGIPPGAGCREDVVLVFEEMEEARNNLAQVRMLVENTPDPSSGSKAIESEAPSGPVSLRDEQYMNSLEWLGLYGLESRKLGLYHVLGGVAFKHQDGIVDIMSRSGSDNQTDAVHHQKLVNARYCERFPVVKWKDGRVVHVQVTPEVHRGYEERVMVALNKFQQRIDWLNQGSRSLFGTICEDMMYILIDTSASMQPSLGFVKQKLFILMQEQLRHKKKFNIVTYNSKAVAWKDRLVDVSERSLQSAWSWVQNLSCWGSTNTYAAIQMAMQDAQTEAIYLLSDGRPDQPPKSIIAQVHMRKHIPIHTISFNCEDSEANHFLFDLAEATGGRYHYFNDRGTPVNQPASWESVDIKLLKAEITKGFENLDKLADLRDECTSLAWKKDTDDLRLSIETSRSNKDGGGRKSAMPPMDSKDLYRPNTTPQPPSTPPPPHSSQDGPTFSRSSIRSGSPIGSMRESASSPMPSARPSSADVNRARGSGGLPKRLPKRPKSAKVGPGRKPMVAGHTRTSLMRTLNSSGRFSPNEWLLPETKQLFQVQVERENNLAKREEKKEQQKAKRKKKLLKASLTSSKQWLAKHGLLAKRLTILDALGSTFVAHKPKYVSILDKNVMSKVFDDLLPIAHVDRNQKIRLVNPNGVNLRDYEAKLNTALDKFKLRLNTVVWNHLSQDDKEKFESEGPVNFEDNSKQLREMLEESDWPIKDQDIALLRSEIARADKFLQQSQALRKAAAGNDDDLEEENEDYDESIKRPLSRISDRSRSQSNEKYDSPVYSPSGSPSPKGSPAPSPKYSPKGSPTPSPKYSPVASPARSPARTTDKSPARSVKSEGLGQVVRSVDRKSRGRVKESSDTIKSRVKVKLDTLRGQKVVARKDGDGLYYPATVLKCADPRHASVKYQDGTKGDVLTRNVIPTGGAVARPQLVSGDCVLMRVVNLDSNFECYVPALVQVGPKETEVASKFYTVIMYNGQKASTLRTYLIKISKERFELASMYIADQQNESRKDVEDLVYVRSTRKPRREKPQQAQKPSKMSTKVKKSRAAPRPPSKSPPRSPSLAHSRSLSPVYSRSNSRDSDNLVVTSHSHREEQIVVETKQGRLRSLSPSDGYISREEESQRESSRRDSSRREDSERQSSHRESSQKESFREKDDAEVQRSGENTPKQSEASTPKRSGQSTPTINHEDDFFEDQAETEEQNQQESTTSQRSGAATPILSDVEEEGSESGSGGILREGMRLEALDRENPNLICVATIDKVDFTKDEPVLIHFDGWGTEYDYWTKWESLDLHPVGYMKKNGLKLQETKQKKPYLQKPYGYEKAFDWVTYLNEVGHPPVPYELFSEAQCEGTPSTETDWVMSQIQCERRRSKSPSTQSIKSSRSSELEKLKQDLLDQQAKQERQKRKLKKKAKELAEQQRQLAEREEEPAHESVLVPSEHSSITPKLIQLRKSLGRVRPGEEVLARWSDDGWYYRGIIRQYHGDYSYSIEDSTGFVERIWREDVISENDNPGAVYQIDNKAVALHPEYSFSYAPGLIINVTDSEVEIELYDGKKTVLPWNEAYNISSDKYTSDVTFITRRESELVGAAVVAREDRSGSYYPGSVKRSLDNRCEYLVGWSDGSDSVQQAIHIFSAFTRRRPLTVGDRVLAMSDPVHVQFLPGIILGAEDGKLMIQFCDGEMREGVDSTLCYWLGQRYYEAAVQYYNLKQRQQ